MVILNWEQLDEFLSGWQFLKVPYIVQYNRDGFILHVLWPYIRLLFQANQLLPADDSLEISRLYIQGFYKISFKCHLMQVMDGTFRVKMHQSLIWLTL